MSRRPRPTSHPPQALSRDAGGVPVTHTVTCAWAAAAGPAWYPPLAPTGAQQAVAPAEQASPFTPLPPIAAYSAPSPAAQAGPGSLGITSIGSSSTQPWQPGAAMGPPVGGTPVVVVPPDQGGGDGSGSSSSGSGFGGDGEPADAAPTVSVRPLLPAEVQASSSLSSASSSDASSMAPAKQGANVWPRSFRAPPPFQQLICWKAYPAMTLAATAQAATPPGA